MKIEHIAIWTFDLELMKNFYINYFSMQCSPKYHNPNKSFKSYFLSFPNESSRIELMHSPYILLPNDGAGKRAGLTHFAISVGSKDMVDGLTERLRSEGFKVTSEPRTTGDGYYESQILDPEGNVVEITE